MLWHVGADSVLTKRKQGVLAKHEGSIRVVHDTAVCASPQYTSYLACRYQVVQVLVIICGMRMEKLRAFRFASGRHCSSCVTYIAAAC